MIEFKDVVGYEKYFQASETGLIFSKRTNKVLKTRFTKRGYETFSTRLNGRKGGVILLFVHKLVALAFLENPDNKPQVNHKDGNKKNNNLSNLEWCTISENVQHAFDTGLAVSLKGEEHKSSILINEDVVKIKNLHVPGKFGKTRISKLLGIKENIVAKVLLGKTWKHIDKDYNRI